MQRTIETILHQNNEPLKLDQYYKTNIEQEIIVSKAEEKAKKVDTINQESKKQIVGVFELTGKGNKRKNVDHIIQFNPKSILEITRKVKNMKKVFIVGDSLIKNITGTGILRANTVQRRPHPGAIFVDMCDYIKPELCHKPDGLIIHCGTNDIEKVINTLKKIEKLVKEIDE